MKKIIIIVSAIILVIGLIIAGIFIGPQLKKEYELAVWFDNILTNILKYDGQDTYYNEIKDIVDKQDYDLINYKGELIDTYLDEEDYIFEDHRTWPKVSFESSNFDKAVIIFEYTCTLYDKGGDFLNGAGSICNMIDITVYVKKQGNKWVITGVDVPP